MSKRTVIDAFVWSRALVAQRRPEVLGFGLMLGCPLAEADHRKESRRYMHVGHLPGYVCSTRAANRLPLKNLIGLFLHEFGHVIGGPSQWDADTSIFEATGIPIQYDERGIEFVEDM